MDFSPYTPLLISAVFGYLLGSIPFGYLLTRRAGIDIRTVGSGNIGATNVLRTGNRGLAAATLIADGAKAGVALFAAQYVFGREAGMIAGAAAFVGHCFPVWLRFKGGKGVATFFGAMLVGFWPVGIACALTWIIVAFAFRYSSLAALCAAVAAPVFAYVFHQGWDAVAFSGGLAALILWRHSANIGALIKGTERKLNFGRAA